MQRGKVQILPLLLAVVVPLSVAIRRGHVTSAGPQTTATHVMNKISLLLRERSLQSRSKRRTMHQIHLSTQRATDRETPGVSQSLSESLQTVIDEVKSNIDEKIKRDHHDTQNEIDTKVGQVEKKSQKSVEDYGLSKERDTAWLDCISTERVKLMDLETAQENLAHAEQTEADTRQAEKDSRPFAKEIPVELTSFKCFPGTDPNCVNSLQQLREARESWASSLSDQITTTKGAHDEAVRQHDVAEGELLARQGEESIAQGHFIQQRSECWRKANERQYTMCNFGWHMQQMCQRIDDYDHFIPKINEVNGGRFSHPDREEQWKASHITQCLLQNIIDSSEINSETLSACEETVDFASDVGELNLKESQVRTARAAAVSDFECDDIQIRFAEGWTWTVPSGQNYHSSDYQNVSNWEPTLRVSVAEFPFELCEM